VGDEEGGIGEVASGMGGSFINLVYGNLSVSGLGLLVCLLFTYLVSKRGKIIRMVTPYFLDSQISSCFHINVYLSLPAAHNNCAPISPNATVFEARYCSLTCSSAKFSTDFLTGILDRRDLGVGKLMLSLPRYCTDC
jgi:hypothetical protein